MWTYEPRQGRNAATVVCFASAVVTLAFPSSVAPNAESGDIFSFILPPS